ncbi:helix-turn-helix transcriptional regulator [Clostridium culturomicium]|uniref:helix-turn-helix transcriptional regulator n=1 Tax=Clostridium culturomicium TaxID=1499683 RepID=UPI00058EEE8B|nr:helix-turn-helix transcriptional regulator [Clostridium culturomicium]
MKLSERQEQIIELVKANEPITSEAIAKELGLTRSAIRPDLSILTMTGILQARPKVGYVCMRNSSKNSSSGEIRKIRVRDIMSKPVLVKEETPVYEAILTLFLNDAGTLFIENDGVLLGAVSRKDFIKMAMGTADMHRVPVGIIMTRMPNIIWVSEDDSAFVAAKKIIEHQVDSLPVIRREGVDGKEVLKIVGKISKTTITGIFVKLGEDE